MAKCQEWVTDRSNSMAPGWRCGREATTERDGKPMCGRHAAGFDRREANRQARDAERQADRQREAKARALVVRLAEFGVKAQPFYDTHLPFGQGHTGDVVVDHDDLVALLDRLADHTQAAPS